MIPIRINASLPTRSAIGAISSEPTIWPISSTMMAIENDAAAMPKCLARDGIAYPMDSELMPSAHPSMTQRKIAHFWYFDNPALSMTVMTRM